MSNTPLLAAARQWAADHGHPEPDDRLLAGVCAVVLRDLADLFDGDPTIQMSPSVVSVLIRVRAAAFDELTGPDVPGR